MARWKLMTAHYLNVPGEEWEYKEQDRKSKREVRRRIPVPRHLDPMDPQAWNNRWGSGDNEEGEVIVAHASGAHEDRDHLFLGDPTPDMVPLDDEARELSAKFSERWRYKPETSEGNYSQSLVDKFQFEMAEARSKPAEIPGMSDLVAAIGALVKVQTEAAATPRRSL